MSRIEKHLLLQKVMAEASAATTTNSKEAPEVSLPQQVLLQKEGASRKQLEDEYRKVAVEHRAKWTEEKYVQQLEQLAARPGIETNLLAAWHAEQHLHLSILQQKEQLVEMGAMQAAQKAKLALHVFMDHSGSMVRLDGAQWLLKQSVCTTLARFASHCEITIFPFSDVNRYRSCSLQDYTNTLIEFDGQTFFAPSWQEASAQNKQDALAIIVSDGAFSDHPDAIARLAKATRLRAVIFYAPVWAPASTTSLHALALKNAIPADAVYHGNIGPGDIKLLESTILELAPGGHAIPDLPGRTRLGFCSFPTQLLLPSALFRVLYQTRYSTQKLKHMFPLGLARLFTDLLSSLQLNPELCIESDLFQSLMSLIPVCYKAAEKFISNELEGSNDSDELDVKDMKDIKEEKAVPGGPNLVFYESDNKKKALPLEKNEKDAWGKLLLATKNVRDLMSRLRPQLRARYERADPNKWRTLNQLLITATTVSERDEILHQAHVRCGAPTGYLHIPDITKEELPLLNELFNRVTIMHASPKSRDVDYLLVRIFESMDICHSTTKDEKGQSQMLTQDPTLRIPIFYDRRTREVDLLTMIRLLPSYHRAMQFKWTPEDIHSDYTLGLRMSKRIAWVVRCFFEHNLKKLDAKKWLIHGLQNLKMDAYLWDLTDDQNITPFWLNVLEAQKVHVKDPRSSAEIVARKRALAVKFFLLRLQNHLPVHVDFLQPTYGLGTKPFISQADEPRLYVVVCDRRDEKIAFCNFDTLEPVVPVQVLSDAKQIARAYDQTLSGGSKGTGGWNVRPTYLTNGLVTLYSKGPDEWDILKAQIAALGRYSQSEINAHLQTLRDKNLLWICSPQDTKDQKMMNERIRDIIKVGETAVVHTEPAEENIMYSDVLLHLLTICTQNPQKQDLARYLARFELFARERNPAQWPSQIDYVIDQAPSSSSSSSSVDGQKDVKNLDVHKDDKSPGVGLGDVSIVELQQKWEAIRQQRKFHPWAKIPEVMVKFEKDLDQGLAHEFDSSSIFSIDPKSAFTLTSPAKVSQSKNSILVVNAKDNKE